MADEDNGLLNEFAEFLKAKEQNAKEEADAEDFEVEIWDKDGRGVRTRRSHARPFLQSLGIDMDPEPSKSSADDKGDKTKDSSKSNRTSTGPAAQSTVRKYFTKPKV